MEYHDIKKNNDIALVLALKSSQLQRNSNINIEEKHLLQTLLATKWAVSIPSHLNDIIEDIILIEVEEIVSYLSSSVLIEGSKMHFNDFKDLLGGD